MATHRLCFLAALLSALHVIHTSAFEAPSLSVDVRSALGNALAAKGRAPKTRTANRRAPSVKSANGSGSCRWEAAEGTCVVGHSAVADLFGESSNAHAQFVAQYAGCAASSSSEEACAATPNCVWNPSTSGCHFVEYTVGQEESPCAKDATGFLKGLIATQMCRLHKTQLACYKDPVCSWQPDDAVCEAEDFLFYIGFPLGDLFELAEAVTSYREPKLVKLFVAAFDFEDPDFDYKDILDWEIPETDCPEWSDELICTLSDSILSGAAQSFYCGSLYQGTVGMIGCMLDPLCIVNAQGQCRQPDSTFTPAIYRGIKALAQKIEHPVDREIVETLFDCLPIQKEEDCKDRCEWDPADEGTGQACQTRGRWIAETIAASGDASDPICQYALWEADAACLAEEDSEACYANPDCMTKIAEDHCIASIEYMVGRVLAEDSSLKEAYDKAQKTCSKHKTEKECGTNPET